MTNLLLVDTSFLYAIYDQSDRLHQRAVKFLRILQGFDLLVPDVVPVEVTYLFRKHISFYAARQFVGQFAASGVQLVSLEQNDLQRVYEVMSAYPTSKLDFVDCCLVAISERLGITAIATFDRRDFDIIRPNHVKHFEILPHPE